jgi:para-nitrobenzyl esterase
MKRMLWAGLLLAAGAAQAKEPVARVDGGQISGKREGKVEAFLGIPYAAPPVGALRWRAPQAVVPWKGVRPVRDYGHDCMQEPFPSDAAPLGTAPAEDCLVANVWRPAGVSSGAKLPVLVWIYGGGNVNGGASPAVYSGAAFARDGVVMVSFNWRVGRFGFFDFPGLAKPGQDDGLKGNFGYMDSIAALKWVRRNVAALGGDPGRVTIYGQSAGAGQVAMLLATPLARGLFQQAIIQSGGNAASDPRPWEGGPGVTGITQAGINFAKRWGIEGTGPAAIAQLRALSAAQVTDGIHIGTSAQQRDRFAGPSRDGRIVDESLAKAIEGGRVAKVPLLIGSTGADNSGGMRETSLESAFTKVYAKAEPQARAAYAGLAAGNADYALREMGRDISYREPARRMSGLLRAQGVPVYDYRFNYVAQSMRQEWPEGPPHATDIPYSMDMLAAKYGTSRSAQDQGVAAALHGYWVNFVKKGDPNGAGLAPWPVYSAGDDVIMHFRADGTHGAAPDPLKARLDAVAAARNP